MENIESVKETVSLIEEELTAIKTIVESNFKETTFPKISPLVVFFTSPDKRYAVISTSSDGDFADTVCRISEVMNIYPLIKAHAAVISMNAIMEINSKSVSGINTFVISYEKAWSITMPYEISSNQIVWLEDQININSVEDLEFDDDSRQMISMFYTYVNVENLHFTLPELLSYLSKMNTAINFFDNHVPEFFDMSDNQFIENYTNVN